LKITKINKLPEHIESCIKDLTFDKKCVKMHVVSIIDTGKELFYGSNWCCDPQVVCPRADKPSGVGYEACIDICHQLEHAEVDVCRKAGCKAEGAELYIIGHYYSCDNCQVVMKKYGIEEVFILGE